MGIKIFKNGDVSESLNCWQLTSSVSTFLPRHEMNFTWSEIPLRIWRRKDILNKQNTETSFSGPPMMFRTTPTHTKWTRHQGPHASGSHHFNSILSREARIAVCALLQRRRFVPLNRISSPQNTVSVPFPHDSVPSLFSISSYFLKPFSIFSRKSRLHSASWSTPPLGIYKTHTHSHSHIYIYI